MPSGLGLVSPRVDGESLDAKLVRPPDFEVLAKPLKPLSPLGLEAAAANALVAELAGDLLKTEEVDAPSVPNGELSDPANAARLDEANAEVDAGWVVESVVSLVLFSEAKGDAPMAFPKALVANP